MSSTVSRQHSIDSAAAGAETLHDFFAASAARFGGITAIEVPPATGRPETARTSYAELAAMAARVRTALAATVRGECVVAIWLPRGTAWLFAAQIGALQAGAAFLCLDEDVPRDHLLFVLQDAAAVAVVTDRAGAERLAALQVAVPPVLIESLPVAVASPPPAWLSPASLAYVIYTSGTTGKPKGVLIEHRSIVNLVRAELAYFDFTPQDRVAQGSSPAYDSSIEETWLALGSGAAVVVMDAEASRLGPDLPAWLRRHRITVLMPTPTLLRMTGCSSPHRELPDLRIVYVGGEAVPADLADRWADGIWLENGYGPTECAVVATRGRLYPGQPVTIGRAIAGNRTVLLDQHNRQVADGTIGELCIAGVGLARGYLRRAELTAERFPQHPQFGRIYRTGDLARVGQDGMLSCLGRIDAQVKVRGHRIELEAVEACLLGAAAVRQAACAVQGPPGQQQLVAFVVPADPANPPSAALLRAHLQNKLSAAAIPARFHLLEALPTTLGGKLDRRSLPLLDVDGDDAQAITPDADANVAAVATAMAHCLGRTAVPADADFFTELGGDSVRAAELVSRLRQTASGTALTVRDVYAARTARGVAAVELGSEAIAAVHTVALRPGHQRLVTAAQTLWLLLLLAVSTVPVWFVLWSAVPWAFAALGLLPMLLLVPLASTLFLLVLAPFGLLLAVVGKRLLIGRYRPQRAPVWSSFYLRHWLVTRLVRVTFPWRLVRGTVWQVIALRCLGARIGRRVHIARGVEMLDGGWDLLELGDDAAIGRDAELGLVHLDDGHVVIGAVRIGRGAMLDVRAGVAPDTALGDGAVLTPLSSLPSGTRVPAGECWDGVPARRVGAAAPVPTPAGRGLGEMSFGTLAVLCRAGASTLAWLPLIALLATVKAVAGWSDAEVLACLYAPDGGAATAITLLLAALALPWMLSLQALVLRRTPVAAGSHRLHSLAHLWISMRMQMLENAGDWLSGTLLWPTWLRLAGMRIGTRCEMSTILDVLPEHVQIGNECFLADGIYLGCPRVHAGVVTVAPVRLGDRTFFGNHVVIPPGVAVPDDVLLGVSTVADPARLRSGSDWFGQPPFELPRREVVVMPRHLTHEPDLVHLASRWFWELLRLLLAPGMVALVLVWFAIVDALAPGSVTGRLLAIGTATAAVVALACTLVLALKWLLLGRMRPGQHALWSSWCSRWDFLYTAWGMLAHRPLELLAGTSWLPVYLRAMGMKIGRRVVLGAGFAQVVDPDMFTFDDGATVDGLFQAHSFEDRVLKLDRVRVGRNATLQRSALMLYGSELGDGARVLPHGVVMKHERLSPGLTYAGAPTRAVATSPPRSTG